MPSSPKLALRRSSGAASSRGQGEDFLLASYTFQRKELGAGTFGQVKMAIRNSDKKACAVKLVDITANEEWELEHKILSMVEHAHVVKVLDMFPPSRSRPLQGAIVLELHDMDLRWFLERRSGKVPQDVAAEISRQITKGVAHVHHCRVIHRDVKPENVLISLVGLGSLHIVISDFGLSRCVPDAPASSQGHVLEEQQMTRKVATSWYHAPELLFADRDSRTAPYTIAIDVWSLGCVMFELVEGRPMVMADSDGGCLQRIVDVLGPCPPELRPRDRLLASFAAGQLLIPAGSGYVAASLAAASCLQKTLQWSPGARATCEQLLTEPWLQIGEQTTRLQSEAEGGKAGLDGAPSRGSGVAIAESATADERAGQQCALASSQGQEGQGTWEFVWEFGVSLAIVFYKSTSACRCSGHCYTPGHRYHKGCFPPCYELLGGTVYCDACVCVVLGCGSPKLRGPLCSRHSSLFTSGPLAIALVRTARKLVRWLMPCDMVDFVGWFPVIRHDLVLITWAALMKEPSAVRVLLDKAVALPRNYSVDDLMQCLRDVFVYASGVPHEKELEQLNRQGMARFMGVASTCRVFGIISCTPENQGQKRKSPESLTPRRGAAEDKQEGEEEYTLGLTRRGYVETHNVEHLVSMVGALRSFTQPPPEVVDAESFVALVQWAEDVDQHFSSNCDVWAGQKEYIHDFLRRKLVIGHLCCTPLPRRRGISWAGISSAVLRRMSPDQKEYLECFPAKWSAAEISRFCFDRDDWGFFVPMFACLWSEVVDKVHTKQKVDRNTIVGLVGSSAFERATQEHVDEHKVAGHPYVLVSSFGPSRTWPEPE